MKSTLINITVVALVLLAACSGPKPDPGPPAAGFDATLGVINIGSRQDMAVLFLLPEAVAGPEPSLVVEGPASWNGGDGYRAHLTPEQVTAGVALIDTGRPWFAGEYRLKLSLEEEFRATLTLPAEAEIMPQVTDVNASGVTAATALVSWTAPEGSTFYSVQLQDVAVPPVAVSELVLTTADSHSFTGLSLSPGSYQAEVNAYSFDWRSASELPEPGAFSWSRIWQPVISVVADGTVCDDAALSLDRALADAIMAALSITDEPRCTELSGLTGLTAYNSGITSLDGLQYAMNLSSLNLVNNDVTDLEPLRGLQKLGLLELGSNPNLTDLEPLSELPALFYLGLNKSVGVTDLSPLSGLDTLQQLHLGELPGITSMAPLSGLTGLTTLNLSQSGFTDYDSLRSLTGLQRLWLSQMSLTTADIAFLEDLPQLTDLNLYFNSIDSLAPLAGLTQLTRLDIGTNPVSDLMHIASRSFEELSVSETLVTETALFDFLANLPERAALRRLSAYGLGLTSWGPLTSGDFAGLQDLLLSANALTSVPDLSGLPALEQLLISNNQLATVQDLENLRDVFIGRTPERYSSFAVYLSGNLFDETDSAITDVIAEMRDLGIFLDWPRPPSP